MPRTTELGKIPAVDLAYAINRLIQEGKTSLAEVRRFAGERPARVAALERELATLKAGHAGAKALSRPADHQAAPAKRPKRKFTMTASRPPRRALSRFEVRDVRQSLSRLHVSLPVLPAQLANPKERIAPTT